MLGLPSLLVPGGVAAGVVGLVEDDEVPGFGSFEELGLALAAADEVARNDEDRFAVPGIARDGALRCSAGCG